MAVTKSNNNTNNNNRLRMSLATTSTLATTNERTRGAINFKYKYNGKVVISLLISLLVSCYQISMVSCLNSSGSSNSLVDWSHSIDLDENYRVYWSIADQEITFEIQVRATGYVGFGFSPDGTIYAADMVIGWIDGGQPYFQVCVNKP